MVVRIHSDPQKIMNNAKAKLVKARYKVTFFTLNEDGSIKDRSYVFVDDYSPEEAIELAAYLTKIDIKDKPVGVELAR